MEVKVTFSLVGGATAAVKDLAFTPAAETPPEPAKTPVVLSAQQTAQAASLSTGQRTPPLRAFPWRRMLP